MIEQLIEITRDDSNATIKNKINYDLFNRVIENDKICPHLYLTFILKTIIDDMGDAFVAGSNGKANKDQFEASIIEDLQKMLAMKTRIDEK